MSFWGGDEHLDKTKYKYKYKMQTIDDWLKNIDNGYEESAS